MYYYVKFMYYSLTTGLLTIRPTAFLPSSAKGHGNCVGNRWRTSIQEHHQQGTWNATNGDWNFTIDEFPMGNPRCLWRLVHGKMCPINMDGFCGEFSHEHLHRGFSIARLDYQGLICNQFTSEYFHKCASYRLNSFVTTQEKQFQHRREKIRKKSSKISVFFLPLHLCLGEQFKHGCGKQPHKQFNNVFLNGGP